MDTSIFDTIFRDENGEIVIAQTPNIPLSIWIGASLSEFIFVNDPVNDVLQIVAFCAIVIWSLQELFEGVNYFRRGLGLLVLTSVLTSKILALVT